MAEIKKFTLKGIAEKITAKTLVIEGGGRVRPGQGTLRCAEVPKGLLAFHSGGGSSAARADRLAGGADSSGVQLSGGQLIESLTCVMREEEERGQPPKYKIGEAQLCHACDALSRAPVMANVRLPHQGVGRCLVEENSFFLQWRLLEDC